MAYGRTRFNPRRRRSYRRRAPVRRTRRTGASSRARVNVRYPRRRLTPATQYRFKRTALCPDTAVLPLAAAQSFKTIRIGEDGFDTSPGTVWNFGISLSSVPGYTEFVSMFDQYRIDAYRVRFVPQCTQMFLSSTSTPGTSNIIEAPFYYVFQDTNNPGSIGGLSDALQYQGVVSKRFDQPHSVYMRPRPETAVQTSGGTVNAITPVGQNPWIDTAFFNAVHNGVRVYVPVSPWNNSSSGAIRIAVFVDVWLSFRGVN